jgi:hypothetical protein
LGDPAMAAGGDTSLRERVRIWAAAFLRDKTGV